MSHHRPPVSWFDLYRQALLETNPDAMLGRMHLARAAMRARLLQPPAPDRDESSHLQDGMRNLQILEREHGALERPGKVRNTDYVTLSSSDHLWLEVSEGICHLLGYSRSELVGRSATEFVAPELRAYNQEIFALLLKTGSAAGAQVAICKDGQRVTFDFQSRVFSDGSIITYWYPADGAPEHVKVRQGSGITTSLTSQPPELEAAKTESPKPYE